MDEKQLEQRAQELKQQFDEINTTINNIVTEANSKLEQLGTQIKTVREEAQHKVDELSLQLEQVRGAYTEITYILHPELKNTTATQIKQETHEEQEPVQQEETTNESQSVSTSTLTTEEINKVKAVTEHTKKKEEDVPDYLKDEYKK